MALVLFSAFSGFACDQTGDDDDDDNNSSPQTIDDDDPFIGCEGVDYEQCESVVAPSLLSVKLVVNGSEVAFPADVLTNDVVGIEFEYLQPQCNLYHGYPFVVIGDEPLCLETQQFGSQIDCSSQTEGPPGVPLDVVAHEPE